MQMQSSRHWDWVSAILLVCMFQVAAARLIITRWTDFLFFSQTLAFLGAILGLALGYSNFKRGTVFWLALGYTVTLLPWQLTMAVKGNPLFFRRILSAWGRLSFSAGQFLRQEVVDDSLLFITIVTSLVWFISLLSSYSWARHNNALATVLPTGLFMLIIHMYDSFYTARIWLLGAYIFIALFLLGRSAYIKSLETWRAQRVFQLQGAAFDLARGTAIAAALLIFVAWTIPVSPSGWETATKAWTQFTKPLREAQDWFANIVKALESPDGEGGIDYYNNQLILDRGNPLSDKIIFKVNSDSSVQPSRHYWRGYVYDQYNGNRWFSTVTRTENFAPEKDTLQWVNFSGQEAALFFFTSQTKLRLLYTPAQPVWVSIPSQVKLNLTHDGVPDLLAWQANKPGLLPGDAYQVRSLPTNPTVQELQTAGVEYPAWVTERYLQLPDDFSSRIHDLALEIIQGLANPYDQASAITSYLRREIEYSNPLPEPPPAHQDAIEWFLFDQKQGFCNYYATAEVLMLRSISVPARIVAGFANGDYDPATATYIVRNKDAHAWPEVYFPGIGWVEFEPTANQLPLLRPNRPSLNVEPTDRSTGILPAPEDGNAQPGKEPSGPFPDLENDLPLFTQKSHIPALLWCLAAVLGLSSAFWLLNRQYTLLDRLPRHLQSFYEKNSGQAPAWVKRWARWTVLSPIQRSFETINRSLRLLGERPNIHATPAKRALMLKRLLPQAANAIELLTHEHQTALYSAQSGQIRPAKHASLAIWLYILAQRIRHDK